MPLNKATLEKGLRDMAGGVTFVDGANSLAKAIAEYFQAGQAGGTSVTLSSATLAPILLGKMQLPPASGLVLETLGTSIQTWALTWAWTGGAFTGPPGSSVAAGPPLDVQMVAFIAKVLAEAPEDPLPELANIIHTWATSGTIIVTLINNQTGAPVPAPVI